MRTCHPIAKLPKVVVNKNTQLSFGGKTIMVPQHTPMVINIAALHTSPRCWGVESMIWDPRRWISILKDQDNSTATETLKASPNGGYFGWSIGPRACPGRKFSQVELVA